MTTIQSDAKLDAKGLACPMPIVRTKKAMKDLQAGQVLEVEATDPGSKADLKAWAESAGHQYLGTMEENGVLQHYLRKSSEEEGGELMYSNVCEPAELQKMLDSGEPVVLLDVREAAEYAFRHIPSSVSIPLGELEYRLGELNKDDRIYVICRSGARSDLASKKLADSGFTHVVNVVPGMSSWSGQTAGLDNGQMK
ncbi:MULTISPECIES: sulfurtransferase TusA family protein [Paenibacillus]|uniref:sulfurtransferase TusA family protein n=1 Tax=Paenibacillus TaxID=44249 RepID=UPI00203CEF4C|nr:sulfurtransferase TusA family protein [Paenibacillus lactis]MCM3495098.1 sulfurtransferase TusA family protein [Paenibacillus lactis]